MPDSNDSIDTDEWTDPDLARRIGQARGVAELWLDSLQAMDGPTYLSLHGQDVELVTVFHENGITDRANSRSHSGYDDLARYIDGDPSLFDAYQSLSFVERRFRPTADGRSVFVETRGDSVMADGEHYRNRYVFRLDISDSRIDRILEYTNPVTAAGPYHRLVTDEGT